MTVYAITDTKKGRTGIAPTYLQTTRCRLLMVSQKNSSINIDVAKMLVELQMV